MTNIEKKQLLANKLAFIEQEIKLNDTKRLKLLEEQYQVNSRISELQSDFIKIMQEKQELAEIIDFENFKNTGT